MQKALRWALAGVAIASMAAVTWVATPARAADLGKDGGVADLEERVAELEAVTARKGNRKVTLTVSGVTAACTGAASGQLRRAAQNGASDQRDSCA